MISLGIIQLYIVDTISITDCNIVDVTKDFSNDGVVCVQE